MRTNLKVKAWALLIVFCAQIFSPIQIMALTSGPAQPEMASFEPFGTTEMVNPFTGDFTYNIPLMDVEGYPINIAYNSGVTMDQEASWVGLGWNLNLGTVNRSVRGLPDDFKGDEIKTSQNVKDMEITTFGAGVGVELFGFEKLPDELSGALNGNFGLSFTHNSYKGFGVTIDASMGPSLGTKAMSANGNVGFSLSSLDGTSFNSSLGLALENGLKGQSSFSFGGNLGSGYNTRTGQKMRSFGTTAGYKSKIGSPTASSNSTFLPIGLDSYTPTPTTKMMSTSSSFSASVGSEVTGINANFNMNGSTTTQEIIDKVIHSEGYGYLYAEHASEDGLKDFNRDKSVLLNKTTTNLSPINFTYDVFSVNGQGVSGTFRPFRNDIGTLSDEFYDSENQRSSNSIGLEIGGGNLFHNGFNFNTIDVRSIYGPWEGGTHSNYKFSQKELNSTYENVYFKAAGELTENDLDYYSNLGEDKALAFELSRMNTLSSMLNSDNVSGIPLIAPRTKTKRVARAKVFSFLTADEAKFVGLDKNIKSYSGGVYASSLAMVPFERVDLNDNTNLRKGHHISEITQINPDGERYVFGLPAYNWKKQDVTYETGATIAPFIANETDLESKGVVNHTFFEDSRYNALISKRFYSKTETAPYAHSFLLTGKQSVDYQDVTGNGITSDDAGNAWKFNYTRKEANFKWRIPFSGVNFSEGFKSNTTDQKANYSYGEKEMWYVHSIESKNQVAEFLISKRADARGAQGEEGGLGTTTTSAYSYQLDFIKLYNKYDRITNGSSAVPIKIIEFTYNHSLCPGIENSATGEGKLTLEKIEISFGNSNKGKLSPYLFTYSSVNPGYNPSHVDRWGNYKSPIVNPKNGNNTLKNTDFPYTVQESTFADIMDWPSAWNLKQVIMPSGGKIDVEYEADDYAYVQNKRAMQMFPVLGAGKGTDYGIAMASDKKDNLYGDDFVNDKFYIQAPTGIDPSSVNTAELKRLFLGEKGYLKDMYFKFLTNITDYKNEYVAGYVSAIDIGYCSDNSGYLWLQISNGYNNAISKTAWGYFREYLSEIVYDQPNADQSDLTALIKGLVASMNEIKQLFVGVEKNLRDKNVAHQFQQNYSFIRLYEGTNSKIGGGSRVNRITQNDDWQNMTQEGNTSTYGQTYEYTTTDEFGKTISSGVATYEPMIGNDENPWRTPTPYVSQGASGHIPAIDAYQETPFGESFFPSASVGYSKVTIKNSNYGLGETTNLITENTYYTAKDFPVIVKQTKLKGSQLHNSPAKKSRMSFPFKNQTLKSEFAASQGYAIILNDMHGKPKSNESFTMQTVDLGLGNTGLVKQIVSGNKYNYHIKETANGLELDNIVEVLSAEGIVENKLLGVEVDVAIDSKRSYESSSTKTRKRNLDVFLVSTVPIPIPMMYNNTITDVKESRTVCLTKVIQKYGIIESVKTYTDQYETIVYNKLYNGLTGEVLLTETQDEHKVNEFQFTIPASFMPDKQRMGGAYENLGLEFSLEEERVSYCNATGHYKHLGELKHGDEVIINDNGQYTRAWVDLDFIAGNTKDPFVNNNCDWAIDIYFGDWDEEINRIYLPGTHAGGYTGVTGDDYPNIGIVGQYIDYSHLVNPSDIVEVIPPKKHLIDHYLNTIVDNQFINDPSFDNQRKLTLEKEFGSFVDQNNVTRNSPFTLGLSSRFDGYTSVDEIVGNDIYDFSNPIQAKVMDIQGDFFPILRMNYNDVIENNDFFRMLSNTNPIVTTKGSMILKMKHYPNGPNGLAEDVYFFHSYSVDINEWEDASPSYLTYDDPDFLISRIAINPTIIKDVIPRDGVISSSSCPNTFKLLDQDGNYLTNITPTSTIKVIRSGNRNMLTASEGVVVATSNPMDLDANGKFMGVKDPSANMRILQTEAQVFTEDYKLLDPNDNSSQNKFLCNSDGQFRQNELYRYESKRSQSSGIKTNEDGFLNSVNLLWRATDNDCYSDLNSPEFVPEDKQPNGWLINEEMTTYNLDGTSLEAKNALNISSCVITEPHGKVEAVASNSLQRNIATENFENYRYLSEDPTRTFEHHYSLMLNTHSIPSLVPIDVADKFYQEEKYGPVMDNALVSSVSHSGNFSLMLIPVPESNYPIVINYNENPINSLLENAVGNPLATVPKTESLTLSEYNTTKTNYYAQFILETWESPPSDLTLLTGNVSISTLDIPIELGTAGKGFNPEAGEYQFSIWVKEAIPSGTPYYGVSPQISVMVGTNNFTSVTKTKPIDGWYRVEGKFSISANNIEIHDDLTLTLTGGYWGAFYDDLRIFPASSNLNTYVYDFNTGRVEAKLDENNFATFYEYDEQGIPAQVKRETERGILTISESRQSTHKH